MPRTSKYVDRIKKLREKIYKFSPAFEQRKYKKKLAKKFACLSAAPFVRNCSQYCRCHLICNSQKTGEIVVGKFLSTYTKENEEKLVQAYIKVTAVCVIL